ncbi:TIR domain-containing protein [uncultured Cohaesibacter sp.]|uniref:TIR domain-containing protein n=1 Tax=uncultured Cohaesibacter sp. TaxID=1002546 RepID=UPI0037492A0E
MATIRRKCFISYHHADQEAVNQFVRDFDHDSDCFIARGLGEEMTDDIIDSMNTDYVMSQIRKRFLSNSTVTIVLLGRCTWSRRYVDWEIQSSLRQGKGTTPNGLLGVKLPSYPSKGGTFPKRFNDNLKSEGQIDCYARHMPYPSSTQALINAIEAAYDRRTTHAHLIVNPRDRMGYNRQCK